MTNRFLRLQLELLIAEYGKREIHRALAEVQEVTLESLEQKLDEVREQGKEQSRTRKPPPTMMELVDTQSKKTPEIAEQLRLLGAAFQNRTFLPNLRDCQRFLESRNPKQRKLKSRAAATPKVLQTLTKATREELDRLCSEIGDNGESDFSALARTIMGGSSTSKESNNRS